MSNRVFGVTRYVSPFHLLCGAFVIVCSFLYGLKVGLSRPPASAHAAFAPFEGEELKYLSVPDGVLLRPMGADITVDGRTAEMATFLTQRDLTSVMAELALRWKQRGLVVHGAQGEKRAVAFAIHPKTQERFTAVAFLVPEAFRARVSEGFAVQGNLSYVDPSSGETNGEGVPGVPVAPGGRSGPVLSSRDPGGRSFTATYRLEGDLEHSIRFYQDTLPTLGWSKRERLGGEDYASLRFSNGREELVMLLSTPPASAGTSALVTVAANLGEMR